MRKTSGTRTVEHNVHVRRCNAGRGVINLGQRGQQLVQLVNVADDGQDVGRIDKLFPNQITRLC